jgi:hypothetical protein
MANVLAPRGFVFHGWQEGYAPTAGMKKEKIATGYNFPIFRGDPVVRDGTPNGYIRQASANNVQYAGIFQGCSYFSIAAQRKIWLPYWPGSTDAQFDPDAYIIDTRGSLWIGQTNGPAIVFANVGNNVGHYIQTGVTVSPGDGRGNPINGISGALLDTNNNNPGGSGQVGPGGLLPWRIYSLYSSHILPQETAPYPGTTIVNGADNTSNNNFAILAANNWDQGALTGV